MIHQILQWLELEQPLQIIFTMFISSLLVVRLELLLAIYYQQHLLLDWHLQEIHQILLVNILGEECLDLADQVLNKQQVKEIHFDLPESLTRESYMQVSRKIQAAVRHSAYNHIHMNGKDKVTEEELDQILLKIKTDEQEGYRNKALALFNIQIPQGLTAKQLL